MGILDWLNPLKGLAEGATAIIDELSTSEEEKAAAKAKILEQQQKAMSEMYDARARAVEAQASVIKTEAASDHWLAANVRPGTLAAFVLIALYAGIFAPIFGLPAPMLGEIPPRAWTVIMIGLGGYVGGRTIEKIAPGIAEQWGQRGTKKFSDDDISKIVDEVVNQIGSAR